MKIKYIYVAFLLLTFFFIFFIIGAREENRSKESNGVKYNTYEEFKKSVGGFPYTAPETKKKYIISNYSKLSPGMTKQQVYDILGKPDVEAEILPKFKFERPKSHGRCWTYYIYKSDAWGQSAKVDKQVNIFYDVNGKADWIVADNIKGLQELGRPKNEAVFAGAFEIDSEKLGQNINISEEKAVKIAYEEAERLGYDVGNMEARVSQHNKPWNSYLSKDSADEYSCSRKDKLKGKRYWAVYYYSKNPLQLGGDICIFIDAQTSCVITSYRGK